MPERPFQRWLEESIDIGEIARWMAIRVRL
jgi:hypothetical protein